MCSHFSTVGKEGIMNRQAIIALAAVVLLAASASAGDYSGGTGEPNDPYLIATAADMNEIGANPDDWDAHFVMVNDVNLADYTGTEFNIIGTFRGVFDGNGHTISNFTYSTGSKSYVGIFAFVDGDNTIIRNLGLINPNVRSEHPMLEGGVGSLVGLLKDGIISCCWSEGGEVIGDYHVGGLIGSNYVTIFDSYSSSSVIDYDDIFKPDHAGGFVGNNSGKIYNCYSTGSVSGDGTLGGLVGRNSGTVLNSFWDTQTSTQPTSDGGTGRTTAQMQDPNTFLDAGWDFVGEFENGPSDIWAQPIGGGYMILWWQLPEDQLPALPAFSGGTGEPDDPYLISTATYLNRIGHNPRLMKAHFKLVDNIDLTGLYFFIIANPGNPFAGVFDGNNRTISNFSYDSNGVNYIGLFAYVDGSNAQIKDLGLIDPNIDAGTGDRVGSMVGQISHGSLTGCWCDGGSVTADDSVGGLVGYSYFANISNSHSTANVVGDREVGGLLGTNYRGNISYSNSLATVSGNGSLGGLVGSNLDGPISNCYASGDTTGNGWAGGLVGSNALGIISNSYSTGSVSAELYDYTGGLVGRNFKGTISNSYSSATVVGASRTGGLAGHNDRGDISNSYSKGSVEGDDAVGGLVGSYYEGTITNCYCTGSVVGNSNVGGLAGIKFVSGTVADSFWDVNSSGLDTSAGGTPKTTVQMQDPNTFIAAGWDFVGESANGTKDIWRLCSKGTDYPKLAWQLLLADFVCPDGVEINDLAVLVEQWLLEKLSADVWPDGGDGFVNFLDWAVFANGWQNTNDIDDLAVFVDQWLQLGAYCADIAPDGGDGVVNMLDFAVFANYWFEGVE